IIPISYQGRNLTMGEEAYQRFQQYENELKAYFLKEEGGEETFTDLQHRMAEILEQKNSSGEQPLTTADIDELIRTIGRPSELGDMSGTDEDVPPQATEKKRLYRNKFKQGKVIAGVCSGIANYFSIDPIAVRLVFVLFTIFNVATLFAFNLGILAYIILWVILPAAYLKDNLSRKLFRNPKDKVLGGVCSGIAQFFNTETWIIRLIFLAPILLGLLAHHSFWWRPSHLVGSSFSGMAFLSYIILWIIVPLAKSSTDFMLLKGEPININTIQNPVSMQQVTANSNSGLNRFLKVIAYIIMAIVLAILIPIAFSVLIGAFFTYNLASVILFTSFHKALALFALGFVFILPFVGFILWLIRRVAGYRKSNRPLRVIFTSLHMFGWICLITLIVSMARSNSTYVSKSSQQVLSVPGDTLYVEAIQPDSVYSERILFEMNAFDHILRQGAGYNDIKAIRMKYKTSDDSDFHLLIERSAFGSDHNHAGEHADQAMIDFKQEGNMLYLPGMLRVSNKEPYHFQNVKFTLYIPKHKHVRISEHFKRQLRYRIQMNNKGWKFSSDDSDYDDPEFISGDDEIIVDPVIRIHDDEIEVSTDSKEKKAEKRRELEDAKREAEQEIEEAKRKLEETQRENQRAIEEQQREAEEKIREAKRKLEDARQKIKDN
ncbi:MAG TPA: PspC domain-containing protein, partial [Chitinophagaceae bacterium]|nr:PspC domain-containing protein [Chitinophagaceae bacterium]